MIDKHIDPARIDLRSFTRDGATLQAELPLSQLSRLTTSLIPPGPDEPPPQVSWRAEGWQRPVRAGEPELWLHLVAQVTVMLECQRCLQPMEHLLEVDRQLRFVEGEDEAMRLDEDSEDDVLALPSSLDLLALVEDELILALPLVPRHDVCPQPLPMAAADEGALDDAPNPFAALAALRPPGRVS